MKHVLTLLLLIGLTVGAQAQTAAPTWAIDAAHSSVNFSIRHFFTPVPGNFKAFTGSIKFDPANLAGSSIDVSIDVTSVNTQNERRDGHLRTPDFFDAQQFPTMTFRSTSIEKTGDNTFVAVGTLRIKDVTKTIRLPFTYLGSMPHPRGGQVAGFKSELQILRNDYGVGTGSYVETGMIGNEVDISILLEVTRN